MSLQPPDLVKTARLLAGNGRRARQTDLRRAVSTIYYALFHVLCRNFANSIVGHADRRSRAWAQAYRALEHHQVSNRCANAGIIRRFPREIQDFADLFVQMQKKREIADYDPRPRFLRSEVKKDIEAVEQAIADFQRMQLCDRRAFAVWVVVKDRR